MSAEKPSAKRRTMLLGIVIIAIVALGAWWYYQSTPTVPTTDLQTLVFGVPSDPRTFDPAVVLDDSMRQIAPMYETLTHVTPDGKLEPRLATSWEASPDGMVWTFHLRQGVKFHDGTEFDSAAVKFNYDRILTINQAGSYMLYSVNNTEIIDPYTIRFTLNWPTPFDYVVGAAYTLYFLSPTYVLAHEKGDDLGRAWMDEHTCGTGPYQLDSWVHGEQVTLSKFDGYWGGWEGKHVSKIIIKVVRDPSTAEIALKKGELDAVYSDVFPYDKYDELKKDPNLKVETDSSFNTLYFRLNTIKPPLDDVRVRQAISYAFPYEDARKSIFLGGVEQLQGPLPSNFWGHNNDLPKYTYDLQKAKLLLSETAYPNGGFTLTMYYYSGADFLRRCVELYKSSLSELGITLDARALPFDELFPLCVNPDTAPHISVHNWDPSYADPFDYLYGMYDSESIGVFNWSFYKNSDFDKLITDGNAIAATDKGAAIEKYKQAQAILVEDAPSIFLFQIGYYRTSRTWVHGWQFDPYYQYHIDFYHMYKELA